MINGRRDRMACPGAAPEIPTTWVASDGLTVETPAYLHLAFPGINLNGLDTVLLEQQWKRAVFVGDSLYIVSPFFSGSDIIRIQYVGAVPTTAYAIAVPALAGSWNQMSGLVVKDGVIYAIAPPSSSGPNFAVMRLDTATQTATCTAVPAGYSIRHATNIYTSPLDSSIRVLVWAGDLLTYNTPRVVSLTSALVVESSLAAPLVSPPGAIRPMPDGKWYATQADGLYEFDPGTYGITQVFAAAAAFAGNHIMYRDGLLFGDIPNNTDTNLPRLYRYDPAAATGSTASSIMGGTATLYGGVSAGMLPGGVALYLTGMSAGGTLRGWSPDFAATAYNNYLGGATRTPGVGCPTPDGYWTVPDRNGNGLIRVRPTFNIVYPSHAYCADYYRQQQG